MNTIDFINQNNNVSIKSIQIIESLVNRGLIFQCSDISQLTNLIDNNGSFYFGIDLTAKSLHVGHIIPITLACELIKAGCSGYILLGSATTRIGDPTGKTQARPILTEQTIEENKKAIKSIISKTLNNINITDNIQFVDNYEWYKDVNIIDFLVNIGSNVPVSKLLAQSTIADRLKNNQHISLLEFFYPIIQGYDFAYLSNKYNCKIQIGGSDQWGNIIQGVDLSGKLFNNHSVGLTTPLLTNNNNEKIGKTASGACWLDESLTSPFDFWQFWRNIDDESAKKYGLMICSMVKSPENNINEFKIRLATSMTSMIHGKKVAMEIYNSVQQIYNLTNDNNDNNDSMLIDNCINNQGINKFKIPYSQIENGFSIVDLLHEYKITSSKKEAKNLIRSAGVKVNSDTIMDLGFMVPSAGKGFHINIGKKKFFIFEIEDNK